MAKIIGLDGGHGLYTAGKQTPTGIKEWTLNDDVCDRIEKILADYDCIVIRTDHNEGQVDEPLTQRVSEYLNKGVESLTSVHHNALTGNWNGATGVEVYTDRTPIPGDDLLANLIYKKLTKYTGLRGRGIKRANFTIIDQNRVPAVLVEGGFMDGTADYKVITSNAGKDAYARAVAEALIEFHNLKRRTTPGAKKVARYQTHDKAKGKWLPEVQSGGKEYAGNFGNAVDGLRIFSTDGEDFYYKAHVVKSKGKPARWLPEVKNKEDYAGNIGEAIDAVMIRTGSGRIIKYAVRTKKSGRWLPPVTGYNVKDNKNGYAGNLGQEIDAVRIIIE